MRAILNSRRSDSWLASKANINTFAEENKNKTMRNKQLALPRLSSKLNILSHLELCIYASNILQSYGDNMSQ